jgi:hypothetical protein
MSGMSPMLDWSDVALRLRLTFAAALALGLAARTASRRACEPPSWWLWPRLWPCCR